MKGKVLFWYRPEGHGSAAEAPDMQKDPAGHSKHAVRPDSSWYLPTSHLSHVPCPSKGCTVPGLHTAASTAPVEQKVPGGQATHSSALVIGMPRASSVAFW